MAKPKRIVAYLGLVLAALITLMSAPIAAAPAAVEVEESWGDGQFGQPLHSCVRPVQPGDDPRQLVQNPTEFDCSEAKTERPMGDYWVLTAPIDSVTPHDQRLNARFNSLWTEGITLYVFRKNGRVDVIEDTPKTLSHRLQIGSLIQYPLHVKDSPVDRLLWKFEGVRMVESVRTNLSIATERESQNANLAMTAFYAGFAGLCFALFVYSIALWATLRYRFHVAYAVMLFLLLCYAFTASGVVAWLYPDISNNLRMRIGALLIAWAAAAVMWFARTFFEEHVFGPRLRLATRVTIMALVISSFGYLIFAPYNLVLAANLFNGVLVAMLIPMGCIAYSAWIKKSQFLWIFALAWTAPVVSACLRLLAAFGHVKLSFWLENAPLISLAGEALISSIGIAYRIRITRNERDNAVAAEAVARRLADVDPLTGLLNRRGFLNQAIGRTSPQTLLILDLDRFKQINDTIGHDGGDEVLRVVSRILRATTPDGALVARLGGEEFVVLCDSTAELDADLILTLLRASQMPFDLRVTGSIGIASGTLRDEIEWKRLYRLADQALYDAKSTGRDRVKISRAIAA